MASRANQLKKIEDVKKQLVANSKDKKWAESMVADLLALQRQSVVEPVELSIPTSEVREEYKFEETCIVKRTIRGWLFQCRNGFQTFAPLGCSAEKLFNTYAAIEKGDYVVDQETKDAYQAAMCYLFQAPLFMGASSEGAMFEVATLILKHFTESMEQKYNVTEAPQETEQDIRDNIDFENTTKFLEDIVDAPIPEDI